MRRLVQGFAAVFIAAFVLMFVTHRLNEAEGYGGGKTVTVYNWGDYIDPALIREFEKETGWKVIYQTFDSNEAMMAKIAQGGATFDVAVPSDYAISKMIEEKLLLPLDHRKLPNLQYIEPRFLNLPFDPHNRYSVPYFWGTVGIVYNREMLGGKTITSWNDLWNPDLRNQILLVDGAREVMGMALNSLGYSLNDTNKAHLQEAKRKLDRLMPNVKAIVGDEIKLLLANEEAAIGVVWSGDAAEIIAKNDKLDYVVPKEGSNLWFDNMVIPKTAKNIEGAHAFINFMLDPKHAAQNAEYVGYSTPNKKALRYLPKDIAGDRRFYPDLDSAGPLEVYENLGKHMLAYYNELFLQFKMQQK
ncbi:Spermidine/putrescine-binding periplasmic protein [Geobacillus stearothermophilus]|uniref:ABC transporter substrate-binding protein n=1 Tax=Geobacillus sp. DSP4a TaxID=2508873 RepID=UPI00067D996A|nr:spermidine/putrescine ABC transporter substrate-binding protein [Geobacillus sp. LC300]KZE97939.1 Spermidine/putrescine-binding periplasmic protein [Geobacillus stearothermophilus]NNU98956.1 ABC transporter substrate-binding protein [Geobacillus sp. DSP4a]